MIPNFPNFKKLEYNDRSAVERFTKDFPPYSDFNFSSMWAWDFNETFKLSILNDNLVLLLKECISDKHYFTIIGKNKISQAIAELVQFSDEKEAHVV